MDRTSINLNFDATVRGAELAATWDPLPGLKFGFAGGYENTRIENGSQAIDLMDRTAGHPGWLVMKPFPTQASNCVFRTMSSPSELSLGIANFKRSTACGAAYGAGVDPVNRN